MSKTFIAKTIAIVLILGVFIGYIIWQVNDFLSPAELDSEVKIIIPQGSSTAKIAEILEDSGLIKNSYVFRYYIKKSSVILFF